MKLYKVDFEPMWPVPYGLVLLAENDDQAKEIIQNIVTHTNKIFEITEIPLDKSGVVFYESGDY
jgi:hypothetical protein